MNFTQVKNKELLLFKDILNDVFYNGNIIVHEIPHLQTPFSESILAVSTEGACGSNRPLIIRSSNQGIIQSPNYPNNYPDRANCQWMIEIENGTRMSIDITDMLIELG